MSSEKSAESMPMLNDNSDEEDERNIDSFESNSIKNSPNFRYNVIEQKRGKPRHKVVMAFHVGLKLIALILYLGRKLFGLGYISTFIGVVILLSMDFWLTKNISGRLLAGLRWWNHVDDKTGEMTWYYESWSAEERSVSRKSQVRTFWASLVVQQCFWVLFFMVSLFSLSPSWLLITFVAVSLNSANLFGYIRARFLHNRDDTGYVDKRSAWSRMREKIQEKLIATLTMTRGRHADGGYSSAKYTQMDNQGNV